MLFKVADIADHLLFTVDYTIDVLRVIYGQIDGCSCLTDANMKVVHALLWTLDNSLRADWKEAESALNELRREWMKNGENG